jgi:hypothetical protein
VCCKLVILARVGWPYKVAMNHSDSKGYHDEQLDGRPRFRVSCPGYHRSKGVWDAAAARWLGGIQNESSLLTMRLAAQHHPGAGRDEGHLNGRI